MNRRSLAALVALLLLALPSTGRADPGDDVVAPHVREGGEIEQHLHLLLDAAFTYGIGGQSELGAQMGLTGYTAVWNTGHATGTLDVGAQVSYGNEPIALAPWLAGGNADGAGHRLQLLVTAGHTLHLGARRRFALGLHLFGGWNRWVSAYSLRYPDEGVYGSATLERDHLVTGAELKMAYRFSRRVGLGLVMEAPFPYESSYVVGMFKVGVGLNFYLR